MVPGTIFVGGSLIVRSVVVVILFIFLLAAQAVIAPRIAVWGAQPQLLVILVVQMAFQLPRPEGIVWPWAAGLGADLHQGGPLGVLALTYGLIAVAVDRFRSFFSAESFVVRLIAVAAAAFIQHLALLISQWVRGQPPPFMAYGAQAFLSVLYTAALAALLLPLLAWVLGLFLRKERRD
jgi:rod shape-determining protein MreD